MNPPSYITSAYSESRKNLPSPSLLSLQWIQQEPAILPSAYSGSSIPNLPSYPTSAYIEVSIDLPSPLPAYTTSAYCEASMNPPSPSHFSYKASDPVKPA